jgi:hypothetical protein
MMNARPLMLIAFLSACGAVQGTSTTDGGFTSIGGDGGLPCDVTMLLQNKCDSCHGSPLSGGAPMTLLSRSDLLAPAITDASKTNAQLSVERMKSTTSPMPPAGGLSADEIATLQNWVTAGTPAGSCVAETPDAGIIDTPLQCSSGTHWTSGDRGSASMHPGVACIACHRTSFEAPSLQVAGTVYPTVHEPDDCNGQSGSTGAGIRVIITEANGTPHTLTPNSAGNFYLRSALQFPITAKVTNANGLTREMLTPQTSGDCNSCHTQDGTMNAPGRIIAP